MTSNTISHGRNGCVCGVKTVQWALWVVAAMAVALFAVTAFGAVPEAAAPLVPLPDVAVASLADAAPKIAPADGMTDFLNVLTGKYSWLTTVLVWIGVMRVLFKPAMSFLGAVVKATPTTKDDDLVEKMEASAFYKTLCYILDWVASIKIGTQKRE